jgi:5'-deoxynucleotidase YfbR-like HD superfamily hydrolase
MSLIHDLPDTRLLNQTFVQKKYYSVKDKMNKVLSEQLRNLKGSEELQRTAEELLKGKSKEAKIIHDSNILEALIEAKEYVQQGVKIMEKWFLDKRKQLKTETGKKVFDVLQRESIYWWME